MSVSLSCSGESEFSGVGVSVSMRMSGKLFGGVGDTFW